jgi:ABC-2 type transport system permease protein
VIAPYGVILRTIASRGRLLAIAALGALVVLVAVAVQSNEHASSEDAFDAVNGAGLALFVPVTALVFAVAALGEMVEDQTLVYVWARPLRRLDLGLAATGAALTVSLPCVLLPMLATALVLGEGSAFVTGTLVAATAATIAYTTLFVGLGVRIPRALVWGLVYIAVWEGLVASVGAGLARTSLRLYSNSLLRSIADAPPEQFSVGSVTALVVLGAVAAAGVALTTVVLARSDVA